MRSLNLFLFCFMKQLKIVGFMIDRLGFIIRQHAIKIERYPKFNIICFVCCCCWEH